MKEIIHKVIAIFLALLVWFSTTSFSVEKHICGEHVFSVSYFGSAEDCGMQTSICEHDGSNEYKTISKESCCQDESLILEGSTAKLDKGISLRKDITYFLPSYFLSTHELTEIHTDKLKQYKNYSSPLIIKDISVLFEVFLI